jgi:hypothetical protein
MNRCYGGIPVQPALNAFGYQIDRVNEQRCAAGLPPLDRAQAIRDANQTWNTLLREAKERLRDTAWRELGRDIADNTFTRLALVHQNLPKLEQYYERLAARS